MVGRMMSLAASRLSPAPGRRTWGPVFDLATHELDMLRYLGYRPFSVNASPPDLLVLRLGQVKATIRASYGHPHKVRTLVARGKKGRLTLDYQQQSVRFDGEGEYTELGVDREEPLVAEWRDFLEAVEIGGPPLATGEEGVGTIGLAVGCERAAVGLAFVKPPSNLWVPNSKV